MEYVNLGKSDLKVSRICMGCMGFGNAATGQHSWTVDEEISKSIIKRGLELGINFYDTAIAYQAGTSEEYLGKAIREYAKRDEVVIATKFLPRSQEEIANGISGKEHVHSSLDASLSHLGMDYVDLYIYHMWDWNTPVEDRLASQIVLHGSWQRLTQLQKKMDGRNLFPFRITTILLCVKKSGK